jgi:hypothetical protein
MADLSQRQKNERRFARRAGFKNEYELRRWVKKQSSIPESDPRYYKRIYTLRKDQLAEIQRVKKVIRKTRTPSKAVNWKYNLLVKEKKLMSPWSFEQKYNETIAQLLRDSSTTDYEKRQLRRIAKELKQGQHVPEALQPGEQGELF